MGGYYKPLTPSFRADINKSIDEQISELLTCERNAFVSMQITALETTRNLIKGLPDGYPIPVTKD